MYGYSLYEVEVLGEFTEQAVSLGADTLQLREKGTAQIPVRLNKPAATEVTVAYATADGTAVAGEDYQAAEGTLTFAPGETTEDDFGTRYRRHRRRAEQDVHGVHH